MPSSRPGPPPNPAEIAAPNVDGRSHSRFSGVRSAAVLAAMSATGCAVYLLRARFEPSSGRRADQDTSEQGSSPLAKVSLAPHRASEEQHFQAAHTRDRTKISIDSNFSEDSSTSSLFSWILSVSGRDATADTLRLPMRPVCLPRNDLPAMSTGKEASASEMKSPQPYNYEDHRVSHLTTAAVAGKPGGNVIAQRLRKLEEPKANLSRKGRSASQLHSPLCLTNAYAAPTQRRSAGYATRLDISPVVEGEETKTFEVLVDTRSSVIFVPDASAGVHVGRPAFNSGSKFAKVSSVTLPSFGVAVGYRVQSTVVLGDVSISSQGFISAFAIPPSFPIQSVDGVLGLGRMTLPLRSDSIWLNLLGGKSSLGQLSSGFFWMEYQDDGSSELVLKKNLPDTRYDPTNGANWLPTLGTENYPEWLVLANSVTVKSQADAKPLVSKSGVVVAFDFGAADWVVAPGADFAQIMQQIEKLEGITNPLYIPCSQAANLPILEFDILGETYSLDGSEYTQADAENDLLEVESAAAPSTASSPAEPSSSAPEKFGAAVNKLNEQQRSAPDEHHQQALLTTSSTTSLCGSEDHGSTSGSATSISKVDSASSSTTTTPSPTTQMCHVRISSDPDVAYWRLGFAFHKKYPVTYSFVQSRVGLPRSRAPTWVKDNWPALAIPSVFGVVLVLFLLYVRSQGSAAAETGAAVGPGGAVGAAAAGGAVLEGRPATAV
ncbi:unnamed protein product [Amoebophrya sp. A25]|nr:unnamed protein product [Amoebophrya sp. A25]|eukprot:GSA25T00025541001.1